MGSMQSRFFVYKNTITRKTSKNEIKNGMLFDLNELLINNGLSPQEHKLEAIKTAYEHDLIQLGTYAFLIQDRSLWMN